MRCESFEPGPSRHVARTNAPPPSPPSPVGARGRSALVCRCSPAGTSCAGLLPLTLYVAGSCRAGRGRDLLTASPGLSSAGVLPLALGVLPLAVEGLAARKLE